jgi:hypothetical protein
MIFDWFDTKEVDALADRLARDLTKRVPPSSLEVHSKKAEATRGRTLEAVFRQVRDFTSKHRLNVYKKARLANRFKWALREAGYPKKFVDEMAFELAALMATTKSGAV